MHRSGTSAVTGALAQLGLAGPSGDDLIGATASNQRGHYESKLLTRVDNQLLHLLGGTWSAPPARQPGWELERRFVGLRPAAGRAFDKTFPARPVAWKDPRNCLVLPFWRSVVTPPVAAVLVYRDGLEVARSLHARSQVNLTHGLALWERYVRTSCTDLDGVATFVVEYGRLLENPSSFCDSVIAFLADVGITVDDTRLPAAVSSLDGGLRHSRAPIDGPAAVVDHRHLLDTLREFDGPHQPWRAPDLGAEPEWVEDVLSLRREYEVLNRQVRSSRAMRLVDGWWRLRGSRRPPPRKDEDDR